MAIVYKVVEKAEPGVKGGGNKKYCAAPYHRAMVDFEDLAEEISMRCTLHEADLFAALAALREAILDNLLAGRSVRLNNLGIFSVSFSTDLLDEKDQVTSRSIKEIRLKFRPDVKAKKRLRNAKFKKHYIRKKKDIN